MGNSEVGHLTIAPAASSSRNSSASVMPSRTGRSQPSGFVKLVDALKRTGGTCHLMGLVSPGGVHSHQDHAAGLAHH